MSRAIDAVGAGNFSEAQDLLRPLSLRSLLQHWKAFLRAVIFSHQGEREKALRGFRSLEPSSLLSRASAPYLALLKEPIPLESKPSDEQLAFGLLAVGGRSGMGRRSRKGRISLGQGRSLPGVS